ncbi:MAG TPA: UDP-N-acetylmuramoyl-L-alanyl-D-glutamate--2,6-diaminopimelate ligase [Bacteroidetes bacterium]|nr:UDP-N-acetylmuramoyl-L-alanyl-D-glutamate--2,6-diaminopimelate ligase [Bacteroidota bacterium]
MKKLSDILYRVNLQEVKGDTATHILDLTFDSRAVKEGTLFIAVKGTVSDGHKFIDQSIHQGAIAIVCEKFPRDIKEGITYLKVPDSSVALGIIADNYYDQPSSKLKVVAVTGTNGKTTVATLLFRLFQSLGHPCGLISTVENRINDSVIPSTHTTPDSIQLNRLMRDMIFAGCTHCFMEASSHAIEQNRMSGLRLEGAIFTNITRDHLDYHKTFENYITAKKKLFDNLSSDGFALTNIDDKHGMVMFQNTKAKKYSYSLSASADFTAKILENSFNGLMLNVDNTDVSTHLVGEFNAYNLLSIYAAAMLLGEEKMKVLTALSALQPAEGRFDYIISDKMKIIGVVDYAHTPDALEKVLSTLRSIRTNNERILTIVGCGGDRDSGKRPMMAQVAANLSDKVILTSDNPRSEDPNAILDEMKSGIPVQQIPSVLSISDRREAIKTAVSLAHNGDIILLAGKGHEKYQEIKGVKLPFDDKEILSETFKSQLK